jgi:hypothetical protein
MPNNSNIKGPDQDIWSLAEQVNSKETFTSFLKELSADWYDSQEKETLSPSSPYGPAANDWENPTLGRFLDALVTWSHTKYTLTGELNVPEDASWNTFARKMAAAKVYE